MMIDGRKGPCRRQVFSARRHLVHQGNPSENCYILLSGMLVREIVLVGGRRQIAGVQLPGDVCGLPPGPDEPASCDIVALSQATCLTISRDWLVSILDERRDIRDAAWRETARELAISAAWIANIGQRHAFQRVAHFVCELAARWKITRGDTGGMFDWAGTQADIGAAVGLSLVHVNKTLRKLEAEGILSWGKRVSIHDAGKLGTIAGFDPGYLAVAGERLGALLFRSVGAEAKWTTVERDRELPRFDPRPIPLHNAM